MQFRNCLPTLWIWRHDITPCSPPGHYDVALTRTVLMHLPPEAMEKTVRHIVKVADEFLHLEYYEHTPLKPLTSHCWLHDYVSLFEAQGCELLDISDQICPKFSFILKKSNKKTLRQKFERKTGIQDWFDFLGRLVIFCNFPRGLTKKGHEIEVSSNKNPVTRLYRWQDVVLEMFRSKHFAGGFV